MGEQHDADKAAEPAEATNAQGADAGEPTEEAQAATSGEALKDLTFAEQVKKIALAAAGAVHVSPDDLKGFVSRLVEKGELAQKDGRRIVEDLSERVKRVVTQPVETAREARDQAEGALKSFAERLRGGQKDKAGDAGLLALSERIHASVERVLGAMSIASAQQVDTLKEQIDELDRKLDAVLEKIGPLEAVQA